MKTRNYILMMLMLVISVVGCRKDIKEAIVEVELKSEDVTEETTTASIKVEYGFPSVMKEIMIHYSESSDMSEEMTQPAEISDYTFTIELTGLKGGTKYYYFYEYDNGMESINSETNSFKTKDYEKPTVTTAEVSEITSGTAKCGGEVTSDGGATVMERGVCWSTEQNPTISNTHTTDGNGTGSYTSDITGLTKNTTYYVRAYATNSKGTVYGEEKMFTTTEGNVAEVTTNDVTDITSTTARSGGNVVSEGESVITARGVCWSTEQNPTISNTHTTDGNGMGSYTSDITGLTKNTTYYVRAYATNNEGTVYGEQKTFTTTEGVTAEVVTNEISEITTTTAKCGGNVVSEGESVITARGVCWSTEQNPTISDSHTIDGGGTGSFVSNITGLTKNTRYYVRAYATNSEGTSYGAQKSFTTKDGVAEVTTNDVTDITTITAVCGGNVTDDGSVEVTARGVCWSTSQNPTISGSHTTDGSGTGSYTSNITGLTKGMTYYVRAYATNETGTSYGEEKSFVTNGQINGYEYVDLGLPSGLKWATCNIGADSPEEYGNYYAWGETETKESYTTENSVTYGQQIGDISGNVEYDAARVNWGGAWRMPTNAEFGELLNNCTWEWTTHGEIKGYEVTGPNGNHIFLPAAGCRGGTSLYYAGTNGGYWSSTPYAGDAHDAYYLFFGSSNHSTFSDYRYYGYSVRPVSE